MTEQLPYIFKKREKFAPNGMILESCHLTVQGYELKDCKKIFDELWEELDTKEEKDGK